MLLGRRLQQLYNNIMACSEDDFAEVFDLGYYILNKILK